jgi:hypothetical protein
MVVLTMKREKHETGIGARRKDERAPTSNFSRAEFFGFGFE